MSSGHYKSIINIIKKGYIYHESRKVLQEAESSNGEENAAEIKELQQETRLYFT